MPNLPAHNEGVNCNTLQDGVPLNAITTYVDLFLENDGIFPHLIDKLKISQGKTFSCAYFY